MIIYTYISLYKYIYIYVLSLLCLVFNVTSKIFHTITCLSFWASNHDVNCCHANWALLVQHQMPAEWNQRPATKPLHLRESPKELPKSNSILFFQQWQAQSSDILLVIRWREIRQCHRPCYWWSQWRGGSGVSASMEHDFPGSQSLISLDV